MSHASNNAQRFLLFFGEPAPPKSERGKLLHTIRHLRALRAWVRNGCYAWWRLTGDIEYQQKQLVALRGSAAPPPSGEGR